MQLNMGNAKRAHK